MPDVLPDEVLVDQVRLGNRGAFDLLYQRYFKRIYYFVDRRLDNRADTEETVQEVFCNVFTSIDGYRGEAPFAAWVFGLTRRTIATRFKKKRAPTVPLTEEGGEPYSADNSGTSNHPSPLESYEYRERVTNMETMLRERLNPEQQTLFHLHHIEDRSISDIARTLDKSENAVKSNLYRTRKILLAR
ncbi:MAG: RNA polymerase sigma factor [Deltaproteobacteria bacterium]|nr:RNA polymerase sigma factor [Deltaproteobacteria bacterium]MBW2417023.1 RNA polymerase sigma factor [Deltaproteobacteria bacterium]